MTAGLPESIVERARALAGGEHVPPAPRHASTVVLVRAPLEVYLIRRVKGMAFAGGMHVFPGGSVDEQDAHADVAWAGPPAAWWGEVFGADESLGRALVCAAVRETFEESGVLLAGPSPDELLADVSSDEWEEERRALEAREQSLSELLARRSLVLRADLLRPLAHWITPEVESKRFDTRFFLAELPAGQVCRDVGGEADERVWVPPATALAGGFHLMPPTLAALHDLSAYDDVAAALAADRAVSPVLPKILVEADDSVRFLLPGDEGYPG
jgi:8-oxo-dGTP pyrophosphatase MutT (NUDIX family)